MSINPNYIPNLQPQQPESLYGRGLLGGIELADPKQRYIAAAIDRLPIYLLLRTIGTMAGEKSDITHTATLIGFTLVFVNMVILQGMTGYTVGKLIMRIQCVTVVKVPGRDGNGTAYPGIPRAFVRFMWGIFDFAVFPSFVLIAMRNDRASVGDYGASTFVYKAGQAEVKQLNQWPVHSYRWTRRKNPAI